MFNPLEFLLYTLAMSISPGPNCLLSMANASAVGLKKGIRLNFGMMAGILINMSICFFATTVLYRFLPKAQLVMKVIAAAYMLYLAWHLYRAPEVKESEATEGGTFMQGFLLQIINPKVYMLGLSAISSYILPGITSPLMQYLLSLSIALVCFLSGLVWAVGGALLMHFFSRYYRITNALFALTLVYLAIRLFI